MNYKESQLLTTNNIKTIKGEKIGIKTLILYLSPHKDNSKGKNLCPKASAGCAKACLFNAGFGGMYTSVRDARRNKTEWFLNNRASFMAKLIKEINGNIKKYQKDWEINIRLNGTSDIVWENIKYQGKNIFEMFPDTQFYDYTKIARRFSKPLPPNYHLTFSRSEENEKESMDILKKGFNVAWVFNELPKEYNGYKVINGDESDVRTQDEKNVIVGLKYKNATGKNGGELNRHAKTSGFITVI
jgi:hypothetical protein